MSDDKPSSAVVFGVSVDSLTNAVRAVGTPTLFAVAMGAFIWWGFQQTIDTLAKPLVERHVKHLDAQEGYMAAQVQSMRRHDELLAKQGETLERVSATLDAQGKVLLELSRQINRRDVAKDGT